MKQTKIILSGLVCLLAMEIAATAEKTPGKVVREITDVETRRFRALVNGDFATLESILADDLSYSHSNGWIQSKTEFMASLRSGDLKYLSVSPEELQVRSYGATVVVTGTAAMRTRSGGQEREIRLRFLDVYVKRQGRWQMVAWQSARLAP